jgi:hypothetical protein
MVKHKRSLKNGMHRICDVIGKRWLALGRAMNRVMTAVLLTVVYVTAFALTAVVARLGRADLLELRQQSVASYWRDRETAPSDMESHSTPF